MLRPIARTDTRELAKSLRAMAQASPRARRSALEIIAGQVVEEVVRRAPRDTNRFVRGWIEAGNAAGVTNIPVPPIEKANRFDQIRARLERQLAKWEGIRETEKMVAVIEQFRGSQRNIALASGDDVTVKRLDAWTALARRTIEIKQLYSRGGLDDEQRDQLLREANEAHAIRLSAIDEDMVRKARERVKKIREERDLSERRRIDSLFGLEVEDAELELQKARLRGAKEEVAIGQLRIDLAKRLHDLETDQTLKPEDKDRARRRLQEQFGELEAATLHGLGRDDRRPASLAAGFGRHFAQVFGSQDGSKGEDAHQRGILEGLRSVMDILRRMEEHTRTLMDLGSAKAG